MAKRMGFRLRDVTYLFQATRRTHTLTQLNVNLFYNHMYMFKGHEKELREV